MQSRDLSRVPPAFLIDREVLNRTRPLFKAILAVLGWGNSLSTTVFCVLWVEQQLTGSYSWIGGTIGAVLAVALTLAQIYTSDSSPGGYVVSLLPDMVLTAAPHYLWMVIVTSFFFGSIAGPLLAGACALALGFWSARLPERLVFGTRQEAAMPGWFRPDNPILMVGVGCVIFTLFLLFLYTVQSRMQLNPSRSVPRQDVSVMSRSVAAPSIAVSIAEKQSESTQGTGNREPGTTAAEPGTGDLKFDIKRQEAVIAVLRELESGKKLTGDRLRVLLGCRKDFALDLLGQARAEPEPAAEQKTIDDEAEPLERMTPKPEIDVPEMEPVPV